MPTTRIFLKPRECEDAAFSRWTALSCVRLKQRAWKFSRCHDEGLHVLEGKTAARLTPEGGIATGSGSNSASPSFEQVEGEASHRACLSSACNRRRAQHHDVPRDRKSVV